MQSQKQKLLELLLDGEPHRTDEIVAKVYGPGMSLARVGARIWDLKQDGYVFEPGKKEGKLWWYQLKVIPYAKENNPIKEVAPKSVEALVNKTPERSGELPGLRPLLYLH